MDFLSSTYTKLRQEAQTQLSTALTPQTQTVQSTIDKLTDRLLQSTNLPDRRASLLALKGMSRDAKREVGETALMALLGSLDRDAEADPEAGKAVLETLLALCERDDQEAAGHGHGPAPGSTAAARGKGREDLGLRHTDVLLQSPDPVHTLVRLLGQTNFYLRFTTLQLLGVLLANRGQVVQGYVLSSPQGVGSLVGVLQERREIIRNEALLLLQNLIASNADLQKIVAFEGAFERLLDIAQQEGGIEGGVVAQDCLTAIELLLKFNVSNQNYFRETSNIPRLPPLLLFPSPPPSANEPAPQAFALQFWDSQKLANATALVRLVEVLLGGVGAGKEQNQMALLASGMTRALVELGLASNGPTSLKIHALNALSTLLSYSPPNQSLLLGLSLTPYAWAGGDEWDRLPAQPTITSLIRTAISGDLGAAVLVGGVEAEREGLECRAAAVSAFEAFLTGNKDGAERLLQELAFPAEGADPTPFADPPLPAGQALLHALTALPSPEIAPPSLNGLPPARFNTYPTVFSCHLFTHLLRTGEPAKASARTVTLPLPTPPPGSEPDEDEDHPPSLIQVLIGNVNLALREQIRAREEGRHREGREWDRACVGWLQVLCAWLWESPASVREFLSESGNVQVLIQPITQASGVDPLVQGLAAFLLGTCYEFNTDPGEITRATLHPILLKHVGADQFVNRMTRLREDDRFKAVTPDSAVVGPGSGQVDGQGTGGGMHQGQGDGSLPDGEVWFDWSFVEFWKNTYFSVQRAITSDPNAIKPPTGESPQTLALISSLQETIKSQAKDLEAMQRKLDALHREREEERDTLGRELERLNGQVAEMSEELQLAAGRERSAEERMREKEREIDGLKQELVEATFAPGTASAPVPDSASAHTEANSGLQKKLELLETQLKEAQSKVKEQEEQVEDAFVALDELSQKRKRDKQRMKEKGLDVSDDETDDAEDEDEPEDDVD